MSRPAILLVVLIGTLVSLSPFASAVFARQAPPLAVFFDAGGTDARAADIALATLRRSWDDGYAAMLVDMARLLVPRQADGQTLVHPVRARLTRFLEQQTGQPFGDDLGRWREWIWARPYAPHPGYAAFKAGVYTRIDPQMARFFTPPTSTIRLDEVDWGGIRVNGIPPLRSPRAIAASTAGYLADSHIVFGVVINGEARAYPKRILAWHEMALDRLGGEDITVVYCTLCGTVIPYRSVVGGVKRTFGTSGLLYRSNKLMFDEETMSLWSTLEGRPVIGALAGQPLALEAHPVVTTTWGEWKAAHPGTSVLSLETGHARDYAEGAAYRDYFNTDQLMFRVARTDRRLKNKDEVLGILAPAVGGGRQAIAWSAAFLARTRVRHDSVEGRSLVVLTSRQGANRVYDTGEIRIRSWVNDTTVRDSAGRTWLVQEDALRLEGSNPAASLPRVPAFRAFWFGWFAQFPDTLLVK